MPQTRFVLRKALDLNKKVVVVVNKIDRPAARCWPLFTCSVHCPREIRIRDPYHGVLPRWPLVCKGKCSSSVSAWARASAADLVVGEMWAGPTM